MALVTLLLPTEEYCLPGVESVPELGVSLGAGLVFGLPGLAVC